MARRLETTYLSAIGKLAQDRELATILQRYTSDNLLDTAWKLQRCSDDANLWFLNAPESGWLHGRYWKCRSKLCSFCLSDESRRRRKQLRATLAAYPGSSSKHLWRFVTFTIENPETTITNTRAIVNGAWRLLRKRACFAAVKAGAKSEEFTLTKRGFHYHLHSLLHFSKRPNYQDWRRNWTECVEASGGHSNRLYGFANIDGYLTVEFSQIDKAENLVNELCKYITKSSDFRTLSPAALIELADRKRWFRVFELIGKLRQPRQTTKPSATRQRSIVHTKRLFAGRNTDLWWFEKRRQEQRHFLQNDLEYLFQTRVYSLHEMQQLWQTNENTETT